MQPFRTLNFSGDYDRDGDKFAQRYHCEWFNVDTNRCKCCRVWPTSIDAPLDRECHTYTPRLHIEGAGDVTRLKTIYAFGEVSDGCLPENLSQKRYFLEDGFVQSMRFLV